MLKRRTITVLPAALRPRRRRDVLPVSNNPPRRRFAPPDIQVEDSAEGWSLTQLNRRCRLTIPFDWLLSQHAASTHLQRLAIHYHEFVAEIDHDLARALILDWIEKHPPYCAGYWLDSWNCYAVSIRCVAWMQWLAENGQKISPQDRDHIVSSLVEQLHFLAANLETDIRGNHLIRNIRCLLWAGKFFTGPDAQRWWNVGQELLARELQDQLLTDGMHFELSPAYHCQVIADLLDITALHSGEERERLLQQLQPAVQVVADLAHPDGRISLFSDGGLQMAVQPAELLETWQELGGPAVSPRSSFAFRDAGYYGWRQGDDYLLIDSGPSCADRLPAHGHGDMLAFEWDVAGLRIIVDAGVSEYEAGPTRLRERSVRSHNTVQVGDRDQCEFIGSFRTGHRTHAVCEVFEADDRQLHLVGRHDGFGTPTAQVVHRRRFHATPDALSVRDEIQGADGEPCTARLLLHHECAAEVVSPHRIRIRRLGVEAELSSESRMQVCSAVWSPDFGHPTETTAIEIEYGAAPCGSAFELQVTRRDRDRVQSTEAPPPAGERR